MTTLTDISYEHRLLLGVIRARREFADEARANAIRSNQIGNTAESFTFHQEADRHEQEIINACVKLADLIKR